MTDAEKNRVIAEAMGTMAAWCVKPCDDRMVGAPCAILETCLECDHAEPRNFADPEEWWGMWEWLTLATQPTRVGIGHPLFLAWVKCHEQMRLVGKAFTTEQFLTESRDLVAEAIQDNEMDCLVSWPCQNLHGGTGSAIYDNVDGLCTHPECHPRNDNRKESGDG